MAIGQINQPTIRTKRRIAGAKDRFFSLDLINLSDQLSTKGILISILVDIRKEMA